VSESDRVNRALCHRLFDAIEANDLAAVADCYAPGMTMWVNLTGEEQTREQNLEALAAGAGVARRRTYDDRRISTFDDGFVVQYTCSVVAHDGTRLALSSCLVAEVRGGRISKLFEYLDSGRFRRARAS
jgi:ketosteroid isomerase-like protein